MSNPTGKNQYSGKAYSGGTSARFPKKMVKNFEASPSIAFRARKMRANGWKEKDLQSFFNRTKVPK